MFWKGADLISCFRVSEFLKEQFCCISTSHGFAFLGLFIRMESMQRIGAGVLGQWKRAVRSLGTAGGLGLDFTFFPCNLFCEQTYLTLHCKCLCLLGCRQMVYYHLLNDSSGFVTINSNILDSYQSLYSRLKFLINEV